MSCVAFGAALLASRYALADENGVSSWLPGSFSSLSAAPLDSGWSIATTYFHTSVWGNGELATAREISIGRFSRTLNVSLSANLNSQANLGFITPTYAFATPVLGGQLALSVTALWGGNSTDISGALAASLGRLSGTRSASTGDSVTGVGDLYPMAALRWNDGVHNFMTYLQLTAPTGAYELTRLSNLSVNHWAVDTGAGYTYLDTRTGHEFSAVAGFTYNMINPDTDYRNGVDFHLDWGASQFLSEHWHVGVVGYVYEQLTPDSGQAPALGSFKSGVIGLGPQVGYVTSIAGHQVYFNLKGYGEFDAVNRPSGWNLWLTVVTQF